MSRVALAILLTAATAHAADPAPPAPPSGPAILQELKAFQQMATVLMIAAHPDDENTQLITYLARGREYRMGYLSVTRGDGGQNLLGPEFGDELGLIRTNELLAARNLDKGRQFFTRAIDFGYSKNPEETLRIWDREAVLGDVVRVIRTFRPDVMVARFSTVSTPGQHGHHTASAILAGDAFKIAGDAKAYPEQLKEGLTPWQPKRLLLNSGGPGGRGGGGGGVSIDIGGMDPVLNQSYGDIAAQSRAMHKTQGFGQGVAGVVRGGGVGPAMQSFTLLAGDPATRDIMDGIDTTWARVGEGGAGIAKQLEATVEKFDVNNPAGSASALLEIKKLVDALPAGTPPDPILAEKRAKLDRLIADCLGITVETTIANAQVTPGEALKLHHSVTERAEMAAQWLGIEYPNGSMMNRDWAAIPIRPHEAAVRDVTETLSPGVPVTQPYWLREEPLPGIFKVDDPMLIGRPMNPPVFPVLHQIEVGGQVLNLTDEPVQLMPDAPAPQQRRPLAVIAPVYFSFPYDVALFWQRPNTHQYDVQVTAARANISAAVTLQVPAGWKIEPATQPVTLAKAGDTAKLSFIITAPENADSGMFAASAVVGGVTYAVERKEIAYNHLPVLLTQPPAQVRAVSLDVQHRCKNPVGYLPGAGDSIPDALRQLGITVKTLTPQDLTADGLHGLDAVVIGVRAFNTRTDLAPNSDTLKAIFDYVAAGGTVVEQYNRPDGLRNTTLAPYNIHLSALRVTDETAKVTFLAPDSPALNTPNKITDADFAGWVQERNIYLPDQFGAEFKPILGMADPGETPPNSSLLIAQHGKGYFVYTSLVFFRELPAGNPGAYRLFANLISLGKQ